MNKILGKAKTVRELLKGVKYSIDYYQREYKWRDKQIRELVDDLSGKFLEEYRARATRAARSASTRTTSSARSSSARRTAPSYIVDGQQRLTSLTLLLILLRNLQQDTTDQVNVDELIFSEKFGQKSFNLDVAERTPCMEALYANGSRSTRPTGRSRSRTCIARYARHRGRLPGGAAGRRAAVLHRLAARERPSRRDHRLLRRRRLHDLRDDERPRAVAEPDGHAQGLPAGQHRRARSASTPTTAGATRIRELDEAGKEVEPDFFKTWLRSQYATKIRERQEGCTSPRTSTGSAPSSTAGCATRATPVGLQPSDDFYRFIDRDFEFYSRQYLRLDRGVADSRVAGLEHVLYNAQHGFTLQYMLLLAPLTPDDDATTVDRARWGSSPATSTSCSHGGSGTSAASPTRRCSTRCSS